MPQTQLIFIAGLVFVAVMCIGGAVIAGRSARARALAPRLFGQDILEEAGLKNDAGAAGLVNKVGSAVSFGKTTERLQKQLAQAGFHANNASEMFLGSKILLLVGGALGTSVLMIPLPIPTLLKALFVTLAAGLLSFVPNFVVSIRRSQRSQEVRQFLPDATDLLAPGGVRRRRHGPGHGLERRGRRSSRRQHGAGR
jgi:hypothetical protein